jgi:signal transduction histidine kinase
MNAIKYTPDGGKIFIHGEKIDAGSNSPEVEISVRDTGIGIAKENHEVVFEKFYQTGEVLMHSSGKTKFKGGGPGLGLAIARGIVEAHGGKIWLDSPGHDEKTNPGTTVYVRLPVNGHKI